MSSSRITGTAVGALALAGLLAPQPPHSITSHITGVVASARHTYQMADCTDPAGIAPRASVSADGTVSWSLDPAKAGHAICWGVSRTATVRAPRDLVARTSDEQVGDSARPGVLHLDTRRPGWVSLSFEVEAPLRFDQLGIHHDDGGPITGTTVLPRTRG